MRSVAVLLGLLLVPASLLSQVEPTRVAPRRQPTMRPEIVGQHGIVAGGRHYSVHAGTRILEQGGNAIDAGVATVFAASVVEISHFGFGGEVPTIIYDAKTKQTYVINGQGTAPKAATPALFSQKGKVDSNGPLGATLPAVMDAMAIALENFGTMRLEQVMAPAIELADGFPMYAFLRDFLVSNRQKTEAYKWGHLYFADGRVPEVGEVFRQPNLARTFRTIVAAEHDACRNHRTAGRPSAPAATPSTRGTSPTGSPMPTAPKAAYSPTTTSRISTVRSRSRPPPRFTGIEINKAGTWDQGPVLLETLNILEGVDLKAMGQNSADYIHTVHEAIKLAYDDRNAYLGDPAFATVPIKGPAVEAVRGGAAPADRTRRHFSSIGPGDPYSSIPTSNRRPPATIRIRRAGRARNTDGDTTCVDTVDSRGEPVQRDTELRAGCSAARSSPATPACRSRTACRCSISTRSARTCWSAASVRGRR